MFGYLIPDSGSLSEEQTTQYKKYYCGLCRSLKVKFGTAGRFFLTYDLTFFALLLSSLYDPDTDEGQSACMAHPFKPRSWVSNDILDYAADMSVFLSALKFLDDWKDDKKLSALLLSNMTTPHYKGIKQKYLEKCQAIEKEINNLSQLEKSPDFDPDIAAESFGNVMARVFSYKPEDYWNDTLCRCGKLLGRYIYIMDACVDLKRDIKKKSPNPLKKYYNGENSTEFFRGLLEGYLGELLGELDRLPIIDNKEIIMNTICRGTWLRFSVAYPEKKDKQNV